ncbi:AP-3 complex subunit delta-1-like isoform X3 [Acipenser ruthenus]|uniref:AP-3 complex subunit delta-1-like isoform X3 n=1 Tax=Acipenser ruthenus TaxID=7906 RepID=UPI0027426BBA|nr:AP-3 complex subunit delta-1-like isoform X3 [Acipenser ruthenus]
MALKMVKGSIDRMFDKNLQDLVRGIRNHKEDEAKFISACIDEIKHELKQDNIAVKANAVCKLTYLQMLGYDVSWAAFNIIEVMSSSKFTFKRIGYLAASQCFHEGTDVIMLTTNQIRKDLSSPNQYDTGVALTGLSCFVTPDLARDLANDIMTLMSHTKPYIRKKAVLIMYKVFLKYPESLRPAFPRLKEKLEDPDPGVQSAAVNVICELARRNPKNYLSLAPLFFKLMTSSTNNWVLIKIIKLFGALTPLEPRLGKKLIEPLTNLIHSTSAMSLLYECVNTVIAVLISLSSGMPNHSASIQLCVQKLRILIEDSDQNLKYLGLLAMSKILKTHPKSVQSHKDLILQCLDDKDESIRLRALDLLYGMVSKKNLMEIVKKLMIHVDKAEGTTYRDELLTKIIDICSQSNYQYITNFEWYISILVELTRLEGTRHGHLIASQMLDVAIRVKAIRSFAVSQMAMLLDNAHLLAGNTQRNGICEVLYAAAWICGEFSEHLEEPMQTLEAMLRPKVTTLPGHIQAVYVQNAVKLFATVLARQEGAGDRQAAQETTELLIEKLPQFVQSSDLEVQERASCILQLIKYIQKLQAREVSVSEEVSALFSGELNPVAPKAQKKVPIPDGLDLDSWINKPLREIESEDEKPRAIFHEEEPQHSRPRLPEIDEKELAKRREVRKQEQASNPFYIKSSPSPQKCYQETANVDHIPVVQIDLTVPLKVPGMPMSDQYVKLEEDRRQKQKQDKKKDKKKKKEKEKKRGKGRRLDSAHTESEEDIAPAQSVDIMTEEMPENALPSDEDDKDPNDPYRALDIDLDNLGSGGGVWRPLVDSDKLPVRTHRPTEMLKSPDPVAGVEEQGEKKSSKKIKKDKEKKDKERKVRGERKKSKEEKKRKKHRKSASGKEVEEEGQVEKLAPPAAESESTAPPAAPPTEDSDLDFWLSSAPVPSQSQPELVDPAPSSEPEEPKDEEEREESKSSKHKKKKHRKEKEEKSKKKKKKHQDEGAAESVQNGTLEEEEEPLPPMSNYSLLAENSDIKMNALPSDEDDKDPNDPYRALDIDLDKPLVDSDKLPVRTHRPTEMLKSPDPVAGVEEQGEKKSSKKIKKDKEKKDKERKKSKEEKKRKKHRKSASGKEVEEEGQVEKLAPPAAESESTAPPAAPPTEDSDLDFWLSSAPVPSQSQPELVDPAPSSEPEEPKDEEEREESKSSKHKKKQHRKEKEEKSKKKKKHQDEGAAESVQNGTLEEEEEPLPPMSNYSLLAENSDIKMLIKEQGPVPGKVCDIQGNLQDGSQVVVSVIFENKGSSFLKSMEFNVMDSLNTKLVRPEGASVHDGIAVPFQLPPGVSNEARFVFTVQSIIMPQKLKGTLTFIVKTEDGSSHEKLDFKLLFTCTSYLITTPCYSDAFAKLLESGELKMNSLKLEGITMPFHHLLAKICFHHHFSVVERIDSCSSMYSRSIQGHHVCLLVKTGDKSVSIDAKCDESTLLSNVLDEIKLTFAGTC